MADRIRFFSGDLIAPPYEEEGEIVFSGEVESAVIVYRFIESGEIDFHGSAIPSIHISYEETGDPIVFSGDAESNVLFNFDFEFTWNVQTEFILDKTFSWNVGNPPLYYYQVEGKCLSPECDLTGFERTDSKSLSTFVQVIAASSLSDLCSKLRDNILISSINWPLAFIRKHSRPVYLKDIRADELRGIDHSCDVLTDQDFCKVAECRDFCIDFYKTTHVVGKAYVETTIYSYEDEGEIVFYGDSEYENIDQPEGITFFGDTESASSYYSYEDEGGIVFGEDSDAFLADNFYEDSGSIIFNGDAETSGPSGYLGLLLSESVSNQELVEYSIDYIDVVEDSLSQLTTTTNTDCGCNPIPLKLKLKHNLFRPSQLHTFLTRNKFSLPSEIDIFYSSDLNGWSRKYHYTGLSSDGITRERWNIIFSWLCTDIVGGVELSKNVWSFSLYVNKKNLIKKDDYDTRVLYTFSIDSACKNNALDFGFSINTKNGLAMPENDAIVEANVLFDEVNIFSSTSWLKDPLLKINISESKNKESLLRYDIEPIFV